MPALRVIECPKGFHKATQTCSGVSPGEGSMLCNLSGRHIADGAVQGSSPTAHSTCSFSVGESGFSDQLSQVSSGAIITIGIPGIPCGHGQERAQVTKGKDREDQEGRYHQEAVSARILARVVGRMTAAVMAVYPSPLHYRALQRLKHKALHTAGYDGTLRVSPEARQDLNWWVYNLSDWNGREVAQRSPEISIETDASLLGWGTFCQGESSGGCWSPGEKLHHINWLELLAVFCVLKAFVKQVDVNSVVILLDNTMVVAHPNKMGGT